MLGLVVATMRDLDRREALERAAGETLNRSLEIRQLDATCEDSIRECVNSLPDRRVDVLGDTERFLSNKYFLNSWAMQIHSNITKSWVSFDLTKRFLATIVFPKMYISIISLNSHTCQLCNLLTANSGRTQNLCIKGIVNPKCKIWSLFSHTGWCQNIHFCLNYPFKLYSVKCYRMFTHILFD